MRPSFSVALTPKIFFLAATLLFGSEESWAQYARGDEVALRPTPASSEEVGKIMSLAEYTAQEAEKRAGKQNPALLPVEKLTPPPYMGKTKTVVVEQAIYRCEKGNGFVFVDQDNKNKFSRCTLFRAEKTAEMPLDPPPAQPTKPLNACTGAIYYRGNTYVFNENEPCPIPEQILKQLLPAATH